MPLTSLRQILDHAAEFGYGMPAFAQCEERFEMFGCSGMATKLKTISLAQMAEKYKRHKDITLSHREATSR